MSAKQQTSAQVNPNTERCAKAQARRKHHKPSGATTPDKLTVHEIASTLAAVKADHSIRGYITEGEDAKTKRKALRFHAEYFGKLGVTFSEHGEPVFPNASVNDFDLGALHHEVFSCLSDFFSELHHNVVPCDGEFEQSAEYGFRNGFVASGAPDFEHGFIVPITVGVELTSMKVYASGRLSSADNIPVSPSAAPMLARIVSDQQPAFWAAWNKNQEAVATRTATAGGAK